MRQFDLCVIGSGPAGQRAAIQAAKLGKRVCVVERAEVVGGAAINTGTIPSKALREAIMRHLGHRAAMPTTFDFQGSSLRSFHQLMNSCQDVIKAEIEIVRGHFAKNDIALVTGHAQFRDANTIDITTAGVPFAPKASSTPNAPTAPAMPAIRDQPIPPAV